MADGIRCMLMRGGTSKGAYFTADDLPADAAERDEVLLGLMGSPDPRQIDGIGGAHPLTSKVAVVSMPADDSADVDYLFLQVHVDEPVVSDHQSCGNLLAGVAPFAIERGLVAVPGDGTRAVRIRMLNTGGIAVAHVAVAGGAPVYQGAGATTISGVPGRASPIRLDFEGVAGSTCGALLPTRRARDPVDGVDATLIDCGMPVVVVAAADLGIGGHEPCAELEADGRLVERVERLRLAAGDLMGLGDVAGATVPKITIVSEPRAGGALDTRTFIPHRCHDAIGVLGATSVAAAVRLPGSTAAGVADQDRARSGAVVIEHPTGTFEAAIELRMVDGVATVERAGVIRTARKLMDGFVFPRSA